MVDRAVGSPDGRIRVADGNAPRPGGLRVDAGRRDRHGGRRDPPALAPRLRLERGDGSVGSWAGRDLEDRGVPGREPDRDRHGIGRPRGVAQMPRKLLVVFPIALWLSACGGSDAPADAPETEIPEGATVVVGTEQGTWTPAAGLDRGGGPVAGRGRCGRTSPVRSDRRRRRRRERQLLRGRSPGPGRPGVRPLGRIPSHDRTTGRRSRRVRWKHRRRLRDGRARSWCRMSPTSASRASRWTGPSYRASA